MDPVSPHPKGEKKTLQNLNAHVGSNGEASDVYSGDGPFESRPDFCSFLYPLQTNAGIVP
jgi:hypothetical protein